MKRTVIAGNTVTTFEGTLPSRTYEIVDSIPHGFFVWNIGSHAPDGFVPLCENAGTGKYGINPDTLKAVRSDHADLILGCASSGARTPSEARDFLDRANSGEIADGWALDNVVRGYEHLCNLPWAGEDTD